MTTEIPQSVIDAAVPLVIAVIGWLYAYIQTGKKDDAVEAVQEVTEFFSTENAKVPEKVEVPARSYKMNEETKKFLVHGESAADQELLLKQVAEAELAGKTDYYINYSRGWYHVNFGLIMGSAKFS